MQTAAYLSLTKLLCHFYKKKITRKYYTLCCVYDSLMLGTTIMSTRLIPQQIIFTLNGLSEDICMKK